MKYLYGIFILWISLCYGQTISAQELGANFNENIDEPITCIDQIKASRVSWVRGFVNIPAKFIITDSNKKITGVKSFQISRYQPTKDFVDVKKVHPDVKLVMSMKIPFEDFLNLVPDMGSDEMNYVMDAIEKFLISFDLGKNIDILVMGNEPEFENGGDANAYATFLNSLADTLVVWKAKYDWIFMVFAGALNRVSELKKSTTIPAVVKVVNTNKNVDGIDLHVHALDFKQFSDDIRYIRDIHKVSKKIITTEFSLNRLLSAHVDDNIGAWGTNYGYPYTMKMYEYLNQASAKAASGNPVSDEEFLSFFESRSWYPKQWYKAFYEAFKKYDAYAVIGRFSSSLGVRNYTATSAMWDLGAIYSGTFMGMDYAAGLEKGSVLVYPEFKAIADSLYGTVNSSNRLLLTNNETSVYPNPATERVFVKSNAQILRIELIDLRGVTLLSEPNQKSIDVRFIKRGEYLLKVVTDQGIEFQKIILKI